MEYKTDCFAYSKKECRVLKKLDCNSCGFYKTQKQYEKDQKQADMKNAINNIMYVPLDFCDEDDSIKKFYITFSYQSYLKQNYAVVYAKNEDEVKKFASKTFGQNWAGLYWKRQWYKNGQPLCDKYGWQLLFEMKLR